MSYFNFFRAHDQFMPQPFRFRSGGFMMPRGRNVSITENINIKNGPSGFWGFMTGLSQGLFGGGFGYGMGMGSIFGCPSMPMLGMGSYPMLNGAATPQGSSQAHGEDAHLKNLTDFYGKSFIIKSHPDKKGIYQAVPKDGGKPIEGTYDELMDKLAEDKETQTVQPPEQKEPEKTEAQIKEDKAKEKGLESKDGKYFKGGVEYEWDSTIKDFKEKVPEKNDEEPLDTKYEKPAQPIRTRRNTKPKVPEKPEQVEDKSKVGNNNQTTVTKLPIHWNIRRKTSPLGGTIGFSGEAVIQFTDDKGKYHYFKAEKNGWHAMVGISEAQFKAILADDLRGQLQRAGLADKYTI